MRGSKQQDFPSEINALRRKRHEAATPMAFLHHELCAKKAVIPFSLSLPVSRFTASLAPFRWSFPPR
jgi:hypothetical protein